MNGRLWTWTTAGRVNNVEVERFISNVADQPPRELVQYAERLQRHIDGAGERGPVNRVTLVECLRRLRIVLVAEQ